MRRILVRVTCRYTQRYLHTRCVAKDRVSGASGCVDGVGIVRLPQVGRGGDRGG